MALKAVVTDIEDVDEQYRDLYQEDDDGNHVLQVSGVDDHPEVKNLRTAYDKEREKRKKFSGESEELRRLKEKMPEDFDPEQWEALKRKAEQGGDDQKVKQVQQEYERKLQEAQAEVTSLKEKLHSQSVERELSQALEAAGVTSPSLKRGATALLKSEVKLDDDGSVVMDTKMGPKPVKEAVKQWAATDEGKDYVSPAKGSGAGGGGGPKGAARKWSEMTAAEKSALRQEDPAEYERLRDEHKSQQR